jgi:hypothetical protein
MFLPGADALFVISSQLSCIIYTFVRRRTKLQFYNTNTASSLNASASSPLTPCLASSVDFGTQILASAANYHFPGEAAAIAPSLDCGQKRLGIWDLERDVVQSYVRAFDDEELDSPWADCLWGHHPRSIFCFGQRHMKTVDLRSAAVSSEIEIGSSGFLPSGRFHGAHSPRDSRAPMIVTISSSALSLWDLRFLREPVAQMLHHLEHDPPCIVSSCIRSRCSEVQDQNVQESLSMDVLVCGSVFGYPLLHSVKLGDEDTPLSMSLPQSIHGLRQMQQQRCSSRALHPDGAQSSATTTSGMCLLSDSLPKGVRTLAFFASLNGNIWLSCVSDRADTHAAIVATRHAHYPVGHRSVAGRKDDPYARSLVVNSDLKHISPSDFRSWMMFPRNCPPSPLLSTPLSC